MYVYQIQIMWTYTSSITIFIILCYIFHTTIVDSNYKSFLNFCGGFSQTPSPPPIAFKMSQIHLRQSEAAPSAS